MSEQKTITYFEEEGKVNLDETMEIVASALKDNPDYKCAIFSSSGEGPRKLVELDPSLKERLIAISFPMMLDREEEKRMNEIFALKDEGFETILAKPPFRDIMLPRNEDPLHRGIKETLNLFSGGMALCVQAVLMARDAHLLKDSELVIAAAADTAIIATAAMSELLFYPPLGMEIQEILCKPRKLTYVRRDKYKPDEDEVDVEELEEGNQEQE